jgi:hypothetical protein
MATSTYRNKNLVRPVKRGKAKRQRVAAQRKRLVGLGMPADFVAKMDLDKVRDLLQRPANVPKAAKAATARVLTRGAEVVEVAARVAARPASVKG